MPFELRTIGKGLAVALLASAVLILAVEFCDAKRGGGGGRGGGIGGGGGGFGGGGFHHRPSGGGSYHRPGRGCGDNDKPGSGSNNKPSGGYDNDYYYGWDNPSYGYVGMAVGTYVHSVPTNCVYEQIGGLTYRRCGDVWYEPRYEDVGVRYVVVERPF